MTFLIVDDNPRIRASLRQFLTASVPNHHTIYEASDGGEAIEIFERRHPDWVFMDIKMEPMDGLAATRRITMAHPDAKIIILTNYDDALYRKAATEAGTEGYVLKEHLDEIPGILRSRVL